MCITSGAPRRAVRFLRPDGKFPFRERAMESSHLQVPPNPGTDKLVPPKVPGSGVEFSPYHQESIKYLDHQEPRQQINRLMNE
jgi:hypothetical protein